VVEADPKIYSKLVDNYAFNPDVITVNAAIVTADSSIDFHTPSNELSFIPEFGSTNKGHVLEHTKGGKLRRWKVPGVTIATLWSIAGPFPHVSILSLDLEGVDHQIIRSTNFSALTPQPQYILFENGHAEEKEMQAVLEWLHQHDYEFLAFVPGCGNPKMDVLVKHSLSHQTGRAEL
jgi:hypothetical protein